MKYVLINLMRRLGIGIGVVAIFASLFWIMGSSASATGYLQTWRWQFEPKEQEIYFQVTNQGGNWGMADFQGFYIDRHGQVVAFDHSDPDMSLDHDKQYSLETMLSSYGPNPTIVGTIDRTQLNEMFALVGPLSRSRVFPPTGSTIDLDRVTYHAFQFENGSATYYPVLIYQHGDDKLINPAPEARALYEWLHAIDVELREVNLRE